MGGKKAFWKEKLKLYGWWISFLLLLKITTWGLLFVFLLFLPRILTATILQYERCSSERLTSQRLPGFRAFALLTSNAPNNLCITKTF